MGPVLHLAGCGCLWTFSALPSHDAIRRTDPPGAAVPVPAEESGDRVTGGEGDPVIRTPRGTRRGGHARRGQRQTVDGYSHGNHG